MLNTEILETKQKTWQSAGHAIIQILKFSDFQGPIVPSALPSAPPCSLGICWFNEVESEFEAQLNLARKAWQAWMDIDRNIWTSLRCALWIVPGKAATKFSGFDGALLTAKHPCIAPKAGTRMLDGLA